MKREITSLKSFSRQVLVLFALILLPLSLHAGEESWFCFYGNLQAYPSGAGKVYAEVDSTCATNDALGNPFSDFSTPAESVDIEFVQNTPSANGVATAGYSAIAVPNDGWIFAGFSGSKRNGDNEFVLADSIQKYSTKATLYIPSYTSDKDSTTALSLLPLSADTVHYALFTHIAPRVAPGQDVIGKVTSSKICNNIGDDVTLTAIPTNTKTTKFAYWINKMTKEKSTDNPLVIKNINSCAYYEAHFDCDSMLTVEFPENGGYKLVYYDKGYVIPLDSVREQIFQFMNDPYYGTTNYLKQSTDKTTFYQEPSGGYSQLYPNEPRILYGRGTVYFVEDPEIGVDNYSYNELKWSGDKGVNIDTLTVKAKYYSIDIENRQFKKLKEGTFLEPKTAYFALPEESYTAFEGVTEAPEIIYWYDPTTTGISEVTADKKNETKSRIYNIKGQRLNKATVPGLYIINGKKVYKLK